MKKEREEICKLRHRLNKKILEYIGNIADKYPELRFCQIMSILGLETKQDRFYEESYDTYQKIINIKIEKYD